MVPDLKTESHHPPRRVVNCLDSPSLFHRFNLSHSEVGSNRFLPKLSNPTKVTQRGIQPTNKREILPKSVTSNETCHADSVVHTRFARLRNFNIYGQPQSRTQCRSLLSVGLWIFLFFSPIILTIIPMAASASLASSHSLSSSPSPSPSPLPSLSSSRSSTSSLPSSLTSLLGPDCPPPVNSSTVRIGVFHCPSTNVVVCSIPHIDLIMKMWLDHVNKRHCGLFGLAVELVPFNLSGSAANSSEILFGTNQLLRQKIQFVILPPGSLWAPAMALLESHRIPAVAPLSPSTSLYQCSESSMAAGFQPECSQPNTRRFQFAHSILSPSDKYLQGWVGLLALKQCASLAMVSTNLQSYTNIVNGIILAASDNRIPIVARRLGLPTVPGTNIVPTETIVSVISELQFTNPDAIVILASDCRPWILQLRAVNYLPKSLATLLCTDSPVAVQSLGDTLNYVVGPVQWDSQLHGSDYSETNQTTPWGMFLDESGDYEWLQQMNNDPNGIETLTSNMVNEAENIETTKKTLLSIQSSTKSSPLQFVAQYQAALNYSSNILPGYDSGAILAGLSMLHGAILSAGSLDPLVVNTALQLYYAPSFYGLLTTDRYGMNQQKQIALLQRDSYRSLHTIYPSQAATLDFIYPMPSFDERVYVHRMFAMPIEQAFIGLIIGCLIFTIALCTYLFYHRNSQIFQAAGVQFYMFMGFGCIVAYSSILSWGVENDSSTCQARIWLWTFAFHAFVGPMVSSAIRIARIYTQGLQSVRVSNMKVASYCALFYLPQFILNCIWSSLYPLRPHIVVTDPLRPIYNYTICDSDNSFSTVVFGAMTLTYSGCMLLLACYLAWRVRKAYSIFNDAKPIALSVYLFTIMSLIVLVVHLSLNSPDPSTQRVVFALRSAGVLIAYQTSLAILFLRRILDQLDQGGEMAPVQTMIGPEFDIANSPHMKSQISDAVWRADHPNALVGGGLDLHRANLLGPPNGLFSRGNESPPLSNGQPFLPTTEMIPIPNLTVGVQFASTGLDKIEPITDGRESFESIDVRPPHGPFNQSNVIDRRIQPMPMPIDEARHRHATSSKPKLNPQSTTRTIKPQRFVPGQALTQSALGEEESNPPHHHHHHHPHHPSPYDRVTTNPMNQLQLYDPFTPPFPSRQVVSSNLSISEDDTIGPTSNPTSLIHPTRLPSGDLSRSLDSSLSFNSLPVSVPLPLPVPPTPTFAPFRPKLSQLVRLPKVKELSHMESTLLMEIYRQIELHRNEIDRCKLIRTRHHIVVSPSSSIESSILPMSPSMIPSILPPSSSSSSLSSIMSRYPVFPSQASPNTLPRPDGQYEMVNLSSSSSLSSTSNFNPNLSVTPIRIHQSRKQSVESPNQNQLPISHTPPIHIQTREQQIDPYLLRL